MTLIDFMLLKKKASAAAAHAMVQAGLRMTEKEAEKKLFDKYIKDIEGETVFQEFLKENNSYNERFLASAINAYLKTKYQYLKPYPAVKPTLVKLRKQGIKLAVVTDAPRLKAFMRLDELGIADMFDFVIAREDAKERKPSPEPFKAALSKLKVKPEECLHIGDWPEMDVAGAKAAGMKTCLAKYGFHMGKYIKADFEIDKFEELLGVMG